MTVERPIERILGRVDLSTGPFGLLGIEPGACTEPDVERALARRLLQVASHALGATAEADEVRLALHVAAAQLRDPEVREQVLVQVRARGAVGGLGPDAGRAMDELVVQLVAHSGGWNQLARRRVASVLHAYGCDIATMGEHVERAMRRFRGQASAPEAPRPPAQAEPDVAEGELGRSVVMYTISVVLIVAAVLMGVTVLALRAGERSAAQRGPTGTDAGDEAQARSVLPDPTGAKLGGAFSEQSETEATREALFGPERVIEALRRATRSVADEPQASLASFERSLEETQQKWTAWRWAYIVRANQEMADFVRVSSRRWRDVGVRAAGACVHEAGWLEPGEQVDASKVRAMVWSAGLTNRLARERSLVAEVREPIEAVDGLIFTDATRPVDRSFLAGALTALDILGRRIMALDRGVERAQDVDGAWLAWSDALGALRREADEAAEDVLLNTIQALLTEGPEVSLDPGMQVSMARLLPLADWSEHAGARRRLLEWFDRRDVSTPDLANVTAWLVGARRANGLEGLDTTFALSAGADRAIRADMRDRYAEAWGIALRPRAGRIEGVWARSAREMLDGSRQAGRWEVPLRWAVKIAAVNASAAQRWSGDERGAMERLSGIASLLDDARAPSGESWGVAGALTSPGGEGDGRWAAAFREARRDRQSKEQLLRSLRERAEPLGPADADVLAWGAYFASPASVQALAQQIVVERAGEPAVVNGLLELIGDAPRTRGVAQMLRQVTGESLPSAGEPGFRRPARAALLRTLLSMLASERSGVFDQLHAHLARQYRASAGALSGSQAPSDSSTVVPDAIREAGALYAQWRAEADDGAGGGWAGSEVARLDSRRGARRQLAKGPMQRFVGEQASVAEMMALVVASEYVSQRERVTRIMDEMAQQRREATSVFEQMLATERAMLRLWMVRFGESEGEAS